MSTSLTPESSRFRSSTRSKASATVLLHFQLPAMISLRSLFMYLNHAHPLPHPSSSTRFVRMTMRRIVLLFVRKRRHAGQHRAFQKFQARAAAGAHKGHLITEFGLVQRLHAVAAADDALGAILLRGIG